jgi:hypothetical protein
MATKAGDGGMHTNQGEAGAVVTRDLFLGRPIVLTVAVLAIPSQLAAVFILVTSDTTLLCKDRYRSAVIVATQTLSVLVSAVQRNAGFRFMVEMEIGSYLVPAPLFVAKRAILGEVLMRNNGAPVAIPFLRGDPPDGPVVLTRDNRGLNQRE